MPKKYPRTTGYERYYGNAEKCYVCGKRNKGAAIFWFRWYQSSYFRGDDEIDRVLCDDCYKKEKDGTHISKPN